MHKIVSWALVLALRTMWSKVALLLGDFKAWLCSRLRWEMGGGRSCWKGGLWGEEQVRSWLWAPELGRARSLCCGRAGGEPSSADKVLCATKGS